MGFYHQNMFATILVDVENRISHKTQHPVACIFKVILALEHCLKVGWGFITI